jgi:pantothenate kinase
VEARRIIGIAGCPGSGKSTLAEALASEDPASRIVVPMDGFHLPQAELTRLGRSHRKGAPDTFDVDGYVALLRRLRGERTRTVPAPRFDRDAEEPVAGAITIGPQHTTIITEGNYLLHTSGGWERVRPLLDACWYVECDDPVRIDRLLRRHVGHGRSPGAAAAWVRDVDEPNARLIVAGRTVADHVVRSDDGAVGMAHPTL